MNEDNKKRRLMEEENVSKSLLKLGIPTMIGMMTSALYNLVDTYFVGTLGTSQTAAVSAAYPLSILFLAIGLLFGTGGSSYLARLLGNRQIKKANQCFTTSVITAVMVSIGVTIIMLLILTPLLSVLGATSTMMPYAKAYAVPFIIGLVINVFNITVNNMIAAEGATGFSMIAMLAGGITNMILDPVLILGCNMGVRGAAIATLISRCVSLIFYVGYLVSGKSSFQFSIKNFKPESEMYTQIFKIGLPMLCYQLLCSIALSATNYCAKGYGDAVVAGIGVSNRILSLGSMMLTGFLKGFQPFVGFNYGAKKYDRVRNATRLAKIWTTAFCVIIGLAVIVFHKELIHAFTAAGDADMIRYGGINLILNAVTFMGLGFSMVYDFLFLGIGKAKEAGMISVTRQGIFFLPLIFLLPMIFGVKGVLLAQPLADILTYIMIVKMTYHKTFIPTRICNGSI